MRIAIDIPCADELSALEKIYLDAFPPEERRPWESIVSGDKRLKLRAIHSDGELAGMISYWDFGGFVYVEHFAIDPDRRSGGIGSAVISILKERVGRPVVLEVEHPSDDNPMAAHRIAFYRRNGFEILPYEYVQPPYAPGLPEVPLLLMCTDTEADADTMAKTLHSEVYGA